MELIEQTDGHRDRTRQRLSSRKTWGAGDTYIHTHTTHRSHPTDRISRVGSCNILSFARSKLPIECTLDTEFECTLGVTSLSL